MYSTHLAGVIFDFNGVMVDDYDLQKEVWNQISQILRNKPVTDTEMVHQIRGMPTKDIVRWMSEGNLSDSRLQEIAKRKSTSLEKLISKSPSLHLNTGLEDFLNELKGRNLPITIATSQTTAVFDYFYKKLKLNRWFNKAYILCYDAAHHGKPAPDPYILAADKIKLKPENCVVFEDALSGVKSAQSAGVQNIVVVGKFKQLKEFGQLEGVIKTIHNFSEITVAELFGEENTI